MKRLLLPALLLLLSVVMVACGGSEETAVPEPVTINVSGTDLFMFDPTELTLEAGQEVNLVFENEGVLEHSWVIVPSSIEAAEATDDDAVRGISTGLVAGGETNTITFAAPAAGTYQIVCTVAGHAAGGMVGELTVTQ
jgi:uncharacterized cupredoxin-like copper-binding protein